MTDTSEPTGTILHVAPDGDDGNSGSETAPLASLRGARDALRALRCDGRLLQPATVKIADGRYPLDETLVFTPEDSGCVRFDAPGRQAIVDAGRRVTDWSEIELHGRRAWVAELPDALEAGWTPRCLWADGVRRPRARFPKFALDEAGRDNLLRVDDFRFRDAKNKLRGGEIMFKPAPGDIDPDWTTLYDAEAVVLHFWIEDRLPQLHFDPDTGWLESGRRSTFMFTEAFGPKAAPYYIDNLFDALTEPGEWFYNHRSGKLFYLPVDGESMEETEIVVPRMETLLKLKGRHFNQTKAWGDVHGVDAVTGLSFHGLRFEHGNWMQPQNDFLAIDDMPPVERPIASSIQAAACTGALIELECARECAFIDCAVERTGNYGLQVGFGCRDIEVRGVCFQDLGAGGIKIRGGDLDDAPWRRTGVCSITDNRIEGAGRVFHCGVGIFVAHSFENVIAHNHIEDLFYTAISVGWSWGYREQVTRDNLILHNRIRKVGQGLLSDLGAIYLLGVQPGTVIGGNHISELELRQYGGWGIYLDEGASHVRVENNLVHHTQGPPLNIHFGRDNTITDNLFVANENAAAVSIGKSEPHLSMLLYHNTLVAPGAGVYEGGYAGAPERSVRSGLNTVFRSTETRATLYPEWRDDVPITLDAWQAHGLDEGSRLEPLPEIDFDRDGHFADLIPGAHKRKDGWKMAGPRSETERTRLQQPLTRQERKAT